MAVLLALCAGDRASAANADSDRLRELHEDPEPRLYSQVGQIAVRVDDTLGGGCFLVADYSAVALRVGYDPRREFLPYVALGGPWPSIRDDGDYDIELELRNAGSLKTRSKGVSTGDFKGLWVDFPSEKILEDLSRSPELWVRYRGATLAHLKLEGVAPALKAMAACQDEQKKLDPFAK